MTTSGFVPVEIVFAILRAKESLEKLGNHRAAKTITSQQPGVGAHVKLPVVHITFRVVQLSKSAGCVALVKLEPERNLARNKGNMWDNVEFEGSLSPFR